MLVSGRVDFHAPSSLIDNLHKALKRTLALTLWSTPVSTSSTTHETCMAGPHVCRPQHLPSHGVHLSRPGFFDPRFADPKTGKEWFLLVDLWNIYEAWSQISTCNSCRKRLLLYHKKIHVYIYTYIYKSLILRPKYIRMVDPQKWDEWIRVVTINRNWVSSNLGIHKKF